MTDQEAIEELKQYRACSGTCFPTEIAIAISTLEEIQQYRALGTAEELREARKKQVPKKPIDCVEKYLTGRKNYFYRCSCCDRVVDDTFDKYCRFCGQKLDWSDTK